MPNYPIDIPALAPLASGADDNPAPAISQGDLVQEADVIAAGIQHRNRKNGRTNVPPLATEGEILASQKRKHDIQAVNFQAEAGVPLWAQVIQQTLHNVEQQSQQQQETLQNVEHQSQQQQETLHNVEHQSQQQQQVLQNLQQQMVAMQQQSHQQQQQSQQNFELIRREIQQESQRSMNRSIKSNSDPIQMLVRVNDGQTPGQQIPAVWFPTDQNAIMDATDNQLSALLEFYDQHPIGTMQNNRNQLKRFLGL
jgi:hypothetical protein